MPPKESDPSTIAKELMQHIEQLAEQLSEEADLIAEGVVPWLPIPWQLTEEAKALLAETP